MMKKFLKDNWSYILAFILFIMGMFYAIRGYCFENPHAIRHIKLFYCGALVYDNCKTHQQKYQFHKENADRCYEEAKDKCWWLPDLTDRKKARYCLTNIGALVAFGDPRSKLLASLVTTLVQYGLDCCDEWEYINNKFYWAQYHYEMAEFYEKLAKST